MNRRQFLLAAAAASGTILLAACAPRPSPAEVPAPAPAEATAAPAQAASLQIMWRTNPDENLMINEVIQAFHERAPDVHVEQVTVPWTDFEPRLMSLFAGGAAPDIYGTGGTNPWIERAYRGMVLPLDPYVEKEGPSFTDDIWPVALSSYRANNRLLALTFGITEAGVFINATQFDEAGIPYPPIDWQHPWTWDEMMETARKLTRVSHKADTFGIDLGHYTPWYYTRLWGGDLVSHEDYASGILHQWQTNIRANYEACIAGLQARADAILKDKVMPDPATTATLLQIGPMLRTGTVAMEFSPGWIIWGELPRQYRFRAATNPVGGAGGSGTTCRNCWSDPVEINAKTRVADQAWAFAKFMATDPDAVRIQLKHRATLPVCKSCLDLYLQAYGSQLAMTTEEQRTFFAGAIQQAETTVPDHILVGSAAIRDLQTTELDPVWSGQRTVKEAVDILIPKVNAELAEYLQSLNLARE